MHPLLVTLPAMSISAIFCAWSHYRDDALRRRSTLCKRVAYMLWKAADYAKE